jgi:hypothetical protein
MLWLDSGDYERWARAELVNMSSSVNRRGLALRARLNVLRRTYYSCFDESGLVACPLCGQPLEESPLGIFRQVVCERCSIVASASACAEVYRIVVISKDEMMPVLLEACPSFNPKWQTFLDNWKDEDCELPHYLALADFARHLIGMLERGETDTFPAIFAAVERLHLEGEHYVKEAATVGLLEDLQNDGLHTGTLPEQFREYLGPETTRWWDKLYRFWERGELLTDD